MLSVGAGVVRVLPFLWRRVAAVVVGALILSQPL
jgi:hypothetical protein